MLKMMMVIMQKLMKTRLQDYDGRIKMTVNEMFYCVIGFGAGVISVGIVFEIMEIIK